MGNRPRKRARGSSAAAKEEQETICFRFEQDGKPTERRLLFTDPRLYAEARRWAYVLAHRRRLAGRESGREVAQTLGESARNAEVSPETLRGWAAGFASAGLVEVSTPLAGAAEQGTGYAARLFPWELVISLLTEEQRRAGEQMAVVRQLEGAPAASEWKGAAAKGRERLLIVSAAPGRRAGFADFAGEAAMVAGAFGVNPEHVQLANPDLGELAAAIRQRRPEFLHLTGYDGSQIAEDDLSPASPFAPSRKGKPAPMLFTEAHGGEVERHDCFTLRGSNGRLHLATPDQLAEAIFSDRAAAPRFVALNSFYSARRLAPRLIAAGAQSVVGFFDTVTDASAEAFFAAFYRRWGADGWRHPAWVMIDALREARRVPEVHLGGGVVLWSARSCFPRPAAPRRITSRAAPAKVPEIALADIPAALSLTIQTEEAVNYACLHNGGSLFREFRVRKNLPGRLPPMGVTVQLDTGAGTVPCRFTVRLPDDQGAVPLTGQVCIPLHAALLRRAGEGVRSALQVCVQCGGHVLEEWTRPVTILSADEWRDDGRDYAWLPSFVLPRDPAVLRILAAAVRYLRAVSDDPTRGFSGYQGQQFPLDADDAALRAAEESNHLLVDHQVRAIWMAIQHEFRPAYYNPPPTYTARSQRLRSPTQILAASGATCVDLTLLFCACLEYIGIFPAIFLVPGHAFPGYWRGENLHAQLCSAGSTPSVADLPPASVDAADARPPWVLDAGQFAEVRDRVGDGSLVPLESTFVTKAESFANACAAGRERLVPGAFQAMLDLGLARRENVTPISLLDT